MSAKPLADRIPPDIAGDIFDLVKWPKNVVVVAHFPKRAATQFAKCEGGALFEQANEFAQIAPVIDTFRKDMNVVRHQAKRMQAKRAASGAFQQ